MLEAVIEFCELDILGLILKELEILVELETLVVFWLVIRLIGDEDDCIVLEVDAMDDLLGLESKVVCTLEGTAVLDKIDLLKLVG